MDKDGDGRLRLDDLKVSGDFKLLLKSANGFFPVYAKSVYSELKAESSTSKWTDVWLPAFTQAPIHPQM